MKQGDEEWLKARDRCAITWSQAAEAIGLGYGSRAMYMKRKLGLVPKKEQNWRMSEGIRREPWACELYYRIMGEAGCPVEFRLDAFRLDPDNPLLGGSVDRIVLGNGRMWIFEAKTAPDSDMRTEIPISHLIQMHGLCHTYQAPFAHYLCWSQCQGILLAEVHFDVRLWEILYPRYLEFINMWNRGEIPGPFSKHDKEQLEAQVRSLCYITEIPCVREMLDKRGL